MKVLRVRHAGQTFYGQLRLGENTVVCLDRTLDRPDPIPLAELAVLSPLAPSKVVCAQANYRGQANRAGHAGPDEPRLVLRPPSAVVGNGQDIVLPGAASRVLPGCALALVLGRTCRRVAPGDVPRFLFGYTCANGLTAADLLERDGDPGRATGFDTFAPMGPWIETSVADPSDLSLRTLQNGRIVQDGTTAALLFSPFEVVSFASSVMTLLPGDVILTGTPTADTALVAGDEIRVEIDAVGVLLNAVRAEALPSPQGVIQ
jgi:2-keto-4-pentenoate hydratase/2-oxohepta-3-ene-1,7-dioic acid hydratase in catechol pathway